MATVPGNKHSTQNILNWSFDDDFKTLVTGAVGYDGSTLQRLNADALATKIYTSGDITYIGIAKPGTAEATAAWQCKKINTSAGTTTITWADGNASFDNVATDLTALTYS